LTCKVRILAALFRFSRYPWFILAIVCLSNAAFATKACKIPVCRDASLKFNEERCKEKADWIAEGRIDKVKNSRQGHPLNKNFASFVFTPEKWIKNGKTYSAESIEFTVGWCHNWKELPDDISGLFRFYGSEKPTPSGSAAFIDFIVVRPEE